MHGRVLAWQCTRMHGRASLLARESTARARESTARACTGEHGTRMHGRASPLARESITSPSPRNHVFKRFVFKRFVRVRVEGLWEVGSIQEIDPAFQGIDTHHAPTHAASCRKCIHKLVAGTSLQWGGGEQGVTSASSTLPWKACTCMPLYTCACVRESE